MYNISFTHGASSLEICLLNSHYEVIQIFYL